MSQRWGCGNDPLRSRSRRSAATKARLNLMVVLLIILHVLVCLFLIGVVLLQQGKSADLASAFGGQGGQTAFGPRGAANLFTRLTTWSAIAFMVTSVALTIALSHSGANRSVLSGTPSGHSAPVKK